MRLKDDFTAGSGDTGLKRSSPHDSPESGAKKLKTQHEAEIIAPASSAPQGSVADQPTVMADVAAFWSELEKSAVPTTHSQVTILQILGFFYTQFVNIVTAKALHWVMYVKWWPTTPENPALILEVLPGPCCHSGKANLHL